MPSNVYFTPINSATPIASIQAISKLLLSTVIEREGVRLRERAPLKVHFGEQKNVTFLPPDYYQGVLEFLKERGIASSYMETSVMYGGQRYKKELHEKTAEAHGFTQLPIIFADGEHGEAFAEVEINKRHFKTFKIGRAFLDYDQLIVLAHFKGHMLAGFGGALKQLSMGCAAKGGKLAMHMGEKPRIKSRKCKQCQLCRTRCNEDALLIAEKGGGQSRIDHSKCVGCGACMAICPHKAITIFNFRSVLKMAGLGNPFVEKVAEGAFAAQLGKQNIYLNFAAKIAPGCDCEPRKMKPLMDDFGVFASTDPVAIDKACWDMARERGKKFRGSKIFAYAESIGLGSAEYALCEVG